MTKLSTLGGQFFGLDFMLAEDKKIKDPFILAQIKN